MTSQRKFPRTFAPGSEGSRVLLELLLVGVNWSGSEKAVIFYKKNTACGFEFSTLGKKCLFKANLPQTVSQSQACPMTVEQVRVSAGS